MICRLVAVLSLANTVTACDTSGSAVDCAVMDLSTVTFALASYTRVTLTGTATGEMTVPSGFFDGVSVSAGVSITCSGDCTGLVFGGDVFVPGNVFALDSPFAGDVTLSSSGYLTFQGGRTFHNVSDFTGNVAVSVAGDLTFAGSAFAFLANTNNAQHIGDIDISAGGDLRLTSVDCELVYYDDDDSEDMVYFMSALASGESSSFTGGISVTVGGSFIIADNTDCMEEQFCHLAGHGKNGNSSFVGDLSLSVSGDVGPGQTSWSNSWAVMFERIPGGAHSLFRGNIAVASGDWHARKAFGKMAFEKGSEFSGNISLNIASDLVYTEYLFWYIGDSYDDEAPSRYFTVCWGRTHDWSDAHSVPLARARRWRPPSWTGRYQRARRWRRSVCG